MERIYDKKWKFLIEILKTLLSRPKGWSLGEIFAESLFPLENKVFVAGIFFVGGVFFEIF